MKLYRIYTEDKNRKKVLWLVGHEFSGFTVIKTTGYWNHESERSLIIEVLADELKKPTVQQLCELIRSLNNQDSVLMTETEVHTEFI